jgi:hypothetical protein
MYKVEVKSVLKRTDIEDLVIPLLLKDQLYVLLYNLILLG